jgi:hypothetical protein
MTTRDLPWIGGLVSRARKRDYIEAVNKAFCICWTGKATGSALDKGRAG